ncbi:MAG TPA: amidohydrolase [Magnetospirillaceae bacterium]|nr:amidohydrolase [Magnetospirillaceae bacterium]
MKKSCLLVACSLLALTGIARAEDLKAALDKDYPSLESLYRTLHSHPELSGQETESAKRLAEEARKAGFEVTEHVGGTGVVAVMKNGAGPTVLLRTELDALPVEEQTKLPFASHVKVKNAKGEDIPVMHACGHDIHMTVWTGTARRMAAEKDKWSGTLVMIAQPAEETVAGARAMIKDGLFSRFPRPDYNVAIHDTNNLPAGQVGWISGYRQAAADTVDIEVKGIGGHGATPEVTRDPVVLASYIVVGLQTLVSRNKDPFDPAVVTVGSIHGGTKHNIIGTSVHMQLTVRTYKDETRKMVLEGIKRIAENEGRAFDLPEDKLPVVTVSDDFAPSLYDDPALVQKLLPALRAELGDGLVQGRPIMASEDFSEYERVEPKIPTVMFDVGAVDPKVWASTADHNTLPGPHSPFWAPDAEPTIKAGVETMVTSAQTLMPVK